MTETAQIVATGESMTPTPRALTTKAPQFRPPAQLHQGSRRRQPDAASGPGHHRDGSREFDISAHR